MKRYLIEIQNHKTKHFIRQVEIAENLEQLNLTLKELPHCRITILGTESIVCSQCKKELGNPRCCCVCYMRRGY